VGDGMTWEPVVVFIGCIFLLAGLSGPNWGLSTVSRVSCNIGSFLLGVGVMRMLLLAAS
jgi:hypothetical protein